VWALPFLSALLAYSERYAEEEQGKRHKKLTDWAWQLLYRLGLAAASLGEALARGARDRGRGGQSTYASLKLLHRCRSLSNPIAFVTRLRVDVALYYEPAPLRRRLGQMGRPRLKGRRLPNLSVLAEDSSTDWAAIVVAKWYGKGERAVEVATVTVLWYTPGYHRCLCAGSWSAIPQEEFAPQALLCTDLTAEPAQILSWFVLRWFLGSLRSYKTSVRTMLGV
jgi:hypothetical protein